MAHEANDVKETCREPGCDLRALPGRGYCLWHPSLDVLRESPERRNEASRRERDEADPWRNCRSALERHPGTMPD